MFATNQTSQSDRKKNLISLIERMLIMTCILFTSFTSFSQTLVSENFEAVTFPPSGWTVINAGTGNNWLRSTATSSPNQLSGSTAYMAYNYTSASAANTWAFTPGISLSSVTNYILEFYYSGTGTTFPEKMKVTIGNGQTVAAQTTTLVNFSNITLSTMTKVTVPFTVASAGTYNIAFNCYSAADEFNLAVDQVNIRVSVIPNAAPTTFTTSAITGTGMTIGWTDGSTNETAFRIYRSTDNINFTQVGTDITSTSSATMGTTYTSAQTGLTPGNQYFYRIAAVADAESAYLTGNATTTSAATYFYTGPATGDIASAANWNTLANGTGGSRSSAQTTDILIVDGAGTTAGSPVTLTLAAAASIGALQVTGNTALTIQSTTATTRTLTLTGSAGNELDVPSGSSLFLNNASNAAAIAFSTGTGMTGSIAGTVTFAGSASNTLTTIGGTGTVVTVQNTGIVNLNNSAISLVGSVATLSFANSSVCNVAGATTTAPPIPLATWGTSANLNITGLTSNNTAPTNVAQSFGNFNYNCPAATANLSIFTTNTVAVKGDLSIVTGAGGRLRLLTSGTLTVGGNINATAGNFDLMNGAASLTVTGNVNVSNAAAGNFANGAGVINIGGNVTVSNTASINFGNAATGNITTISGNVNLNSSGTSVLSLTSGTTQVVNVNGDFSMSAGVFGIGSGTGGGALKVKGNFIQTGGAIGLTGSATTGTIEFNGSSAQNVTFSSAMTGLVNVRLNNPGGINLTGPLAINNGASYTISNGTTTGSGSITFNATSSKLIYNGTTGAQTANSLEFPSSNGPTDLTINNTATAPNNIVNMAFSRTLGTAGVLAMTAGIVNNSGNTITVPNATAAAVTGGSATSYVNGIIIRSLPAGLVSGSTYLFPLGKGTYGAFDLINPTTNAGGPVTIQAEVIDGNSGGTPGTLMSAISSTRYWTASITSGASNFTNTLIKLTDTRGLQDGIGASSSINGAYDHIGGAVSTLAAGSITTTVPAVTTLAGFFAMGNLAGPSFSNLVITAAGNQCTNVARTVTVTVTPGAAAVTTVTLNYQVNAGTVQNVTMTNTSGNNWSGVIPTVTPVNGTVTWSVTATDANSIAVTTNGTAYTDEPALGVTAIASATVTTLCAGDPTTLSVVLNKAAAYTLGAGASTTSGSGATGGNNVSPFSHYYGGYKFQYVIRSTELTGVGATAGNITKMAFNVATAGTTYTGFSIRISHTASAAASASVFIAGTFTDVYSGNYTPAVGINDIVFNSPFSWDGTSNLLIEICWSNNNSGGIAAEVKYDAPGFNAQSFYRDDSEDASAMCAELTPEARQNNRPQLRFTFNSPPAATAYSWSDGTNVVGTTNPLTVNTTTNTTYTATVTTFGCPVVSNGVSIIANPLPGMPGANNSTQCGTQVPGAFVTSGGGGGGFNWYDAQTGGNLLQTGGATYITAISATTHFWVSESNGNCESPRAEVVATVNPPDAVQASVDNNNPCANTSIQLTATQTSFGNGNAYSYTWSAIPSSGSGIPTTLAGGTGITTNTSVTPTAAGTYTYTVTAVDGACTTASQVVVTVKLLPFLNVPTANPVAICEGNSSTLTATTSTVSPGNITVGAGAVTTINNSNSSTTYNSPFSHYWGGYKAQYLVRASELTAQNLTTGNLTSVSFDIAAIGTTYNGFVMNIAQTPSTALTTTFINTGFTQVFSGDLAVTTTGLKTINFSTPFAWDGTSNIVVQICWSNNNTGGTGAEVKTDNTAYAATAQYHDDSQTPTTICGITTASGTLTERPKMIITGQIISTGVGGLNYNWAPGSLNGNVVSVSPSNTTVYTVTATNPSTTCFSTATVTVTVNPLPPAPSGANGTDQCGTALTDASVSSNNTTDPQVPPIFNWYLVPTGGSPAQTGTSTTYNTPVSATTTFYVSEVSLNGCEGPRAEITTVVSDPDLLAVSATITSACIGSSTDISSTYTPDFNSFATFDLTASPASGSGVTGTVSLTPNSTGSDSYTVTPTATGTYTYTITAYDPDKGCTSVNSVVVTVSSLPTIESASASPSTPVCAGSSVNLTALTNTITAGTRTLGNGASSNSTTTTVGTFYASYYGNGHTQILYTAAELTAAGLTAGNITSLGVVLSSIGTSPVTMNGYTIKIAHTSATTITTFQPPSFTTVYGPVNYTPVVGTNTNPFSTPFAWNGTSNIIVDYCFANGITGASANTTINTYSTTAFGSFVNYQVDAVVSDPCSNTTVSNASSNRPNLIFAGQVVTAGAGVYNWTWNPGNLSNNSVSVNPTVTTTYTATATLNGCSVNSAPVTVTVNPLPATPSTNDPVTRCGPGSVTLTATGTGGILNWYNVLSGGTSLQTGGTYSPNVTGSIIYYVSETSAAGCEGPRAAVNVTVTTAPTLAITPGSATTFCLNGSVTLNGSIASDPSYINFSWSASPSSGSGLSASTGSTVTAAPAIAGTYTYTLASDDGNANGCSNTAIMVVTVNPNPVIASVNANPSTVCSGGASTLTANTNVIVPGISSSIGTGTTLTNASNTDPTAFNNRFAQYWSQTVYTAAELQAAGLQAGNITGIVYNINTLGDGTTNPNFSISIGTSASATVSTFTTTGLTQVFGPTTYTHAIGLNIVNFTIPYNWDGVSNIVIDARHDGADLADNARTFYTATAGNTTISAISSTASSTTTLQTLVANATVTPGLSTKRINLIFNGQVSGTGAGGLNWVWNPGNLSGNSVAVNPTVTTTYTATASYPGTGCSVNSAPITVTVTPVAANATASPSIPVCAGTLVTLNGGASGGGPFLYSWTDGVTVIGTSSTVLVNPTVTSTYTVTVTDNCSNSTTSSVTINVNPLPTASIAEAGPIAICAPATQVLTAVTNAASPTYQWQLNGINISGAISATYTVTGTGSYTVIVTDASTGCISTISATVAVTINVKPSAVAVTPPTSTICNGTIVNLTASVASLSVTSGTGVSTSVGNTTASTLGPNPFQIFYGGDKQQMLYLASELSALGMGTGSAISAIKFNLPTADPAVSLTSLRVKMKNTTTNALSTWEAGMTIVRTAAAFAPVVGINPLPLNTAFVWDGTSNLVIEVTYSNNNSGTTGTIYNTAKYSPTSFASTIFYRVDAASAATLNNYTGAVSFTYNSRNDITFDFSNPATSITWSPAAGLFTNAGATTAYTGTNLASVFAKPSTTTTYTATAVNAAGCTNNGTSVLTVNPRPTGTISGGATYCSGQGSTATTLSIAVTGAGPWNGTLSPGAIPFSGSSSPISVVVTPSSTTTYTIATLNGSLCNAISADLGGSATITINPAPATPTISTGGPTTFCSGGSVILTSSSVSGNQWNLNDLPISGQNAQTLNVVASGDYSVTVTNEFNCSATSTNTTVTVNPTPATPTINAGGPTTFCQGGSVVLTSSSATNNQWNLDSSPIGGETNQAITVITSGNYTVTVTNAFNCSATSVITTVTVNPLAASPTAVVSVQPTCAVGTGTITVTAPLGTGNSYTLDGTTTISWPTVSFAGVTPGPHTITVSNSFGCSAPASTSVTVDPQPFIPGTPVVTGTVNVCPYIGTTTQLTYHATATGNGTQVFNWVIPTTNVTIVSGQGTADLVLTFQNGFAAQANKQLRLTVTNQCGTSSMTIYYLLAQFPNTPNPITGPTNVCALIGTATTATYTTNKAAGALTYNWSTPANTVVSHPNGAGVNDTTIVVTFNTGFTGGNISVVAENLCGPSGTRTLTIVNTPPSTPGLISGPTNGCPHVAPGGTAATYSITPVPFATSYTWTTPAGSVVTHPNGAGANDNTITVVFPAGFTSGTVTVSATNGCGTGGVRSLSITKLNPATPSVIDIVQTRFCGDPLGRAYTYALAGMPANATAVVWTIPAGATSVNITPIKIEVTYPNTAVDGVVTAQATSNCAVSTIRSAPAKYPACPPPGFAAGKGETITPGPITKAMEVKIFPNPTVSDFKLQVLTSGSEEITVRVMDNLGRLYKSFKMMPYQTIALGAELKAGSYLIEVRQGSEVKTSKLIKF